MTDRLEPSMGRSAHVAATFAPDLVDSRATERPITVDQTNFSVVVGERVVVKWLRAPVTGEHPAVRLMTHLREVGFSEMPPFFGALVVDGATEAIVTGFVEGALDGWDWYVEELTAATETGELAAPLESAQRLGSLTGRLHRALATPSGTIPEPLQRDSLAGEAQRGLDLLAEAGDTLVVAARAVEISAVIGRLGERTAGIVQPIHGDLHVGQILRTSMPDAMFVNDFDGSPVVSPAERLRPRSTLIDIASMLQSIDHVGRVVANRRPDLAAAVDAFLADAAVTALAGYCTAVGTEEPIDLPALFTLSIIQELHEFVYARRSLPRWSYVPEAALAALLPR